MKNYALFPMRIGDQMLRRLIVNSLSGESAQIMSMRFLTSEMAIVSSTYPSSLNLKISGAVTNMVKILRAQEKTKISEILATGSTSVGQEVITDKIRAGWLKKQLDFIDSCDDILAQVATIVNSISGDSETAPQLIANNDAAAIMKTFAMWGEDPKDNRRSAFRDIYYQVRGRLTQATLNIWEDSGYQSFASAVNQFEQDKLNPLSVAPASLFMHEFESEDANPRSLIRKKFSAAIIGSGNSLRMSYPYVPCGIVPEFGRFFYENSNEKDTLSAILFSPAALLKRITGNVNGKEMAGEDDKAADGFLTYLTDYAIVCGLDNAKSVIKDHMGKEGRELTDVTAASELVKEAARCKDLMCLKLFLNMSPIIALAQLGLELSYPAEFIEDFKSYYPDVAAAYDVDHLLSTFKGLPIAAKTADFLENFGFTRFFDTDAHRYVALNFFPDSTNDKFYITPEGEYQKRNADTSNLESIDSTDSEAINEAAAFFLRKNMMDLVESIKQLQVFLNDHVMVSNYTKGAAFWNTSKLKVSPQNVKFNEIPTIVTSHGVNISGKLNNLEELDRSFVLDRGFNMMDGCTAGVISNGEKVPSILMHKRAYGYINYNQYYKEVISLLNKATNKKNNKTMISGHALSKINLPLFCIERHGLERELDHQCADLSFLDTGPGSMLPMSIEGFMPISKDTKIGLYNKQLVGEYSIPSDAIPYQYMHTPPKSEKDSLSLADSFIDSVLNLDEANFRAGNNIPAYANGTITGDEALISSRILRRFCIKGSATKNTVNDVFYFSIISDVVIRHDWFVAASAMDFIMFKNNVPSFIDIMHPILTYGKRSDDDDKDDLSPFKITGRGTELRRVHLSGLLPVVDLLKPEARSQSISMVMSPINALAGAKDYTGLVSVYSYVQSKARMSKGGFSGKKENI